MAPRINTAYTSDWPARSPDPDLPLFAQVGMPAAVQVRSAGIAAAVEDPEGAAEVQKHAALADVEARHGELIRAAELHLLRALLTSPTATATVEVVHKPMGLSPEVRKPWLGAVPRRLVNLKIIERVGFVPGGRRESHARPLSLWVLRDRPAAERFLAAVPKEEKIARP